MKKLYLALALFLLPIYAKAATCFQVPLAVSGAVAGTAGVCRLTVSAITGSGQLAGDTVNVAGITGATGCNVSTTISTVVDSTHIELAGTTFGGVYAAGGTVGGGHWGTTNTTNWASSTGGTVGTCAATGGVPKQAADTATFDALSGGGTVTVDTTINGVTLTQITSGAFTGTLDFSVNNPSITLTNSFSSNGTGTRTIKLGSGTFTMTLALNTAWDFFGTGLTLNAGTSTISFTATTLGAGLTVQLGSGTTYATMTFAAVTNGLSTFINTNSGATITTLNITGPRNFSIQQSGTLTVTNAFNWVGSTSNPILLESSNSGAAATISVASGSPTMSGVSIRSMTFSGGATFTATSSIDLKGNTGITITPPTGGSSGHIIGG